MEDKKRLKKEADHSRLTRSKQHIQYMTRRDLGRWKCHKKEDTGVPKSPYKETTKLPARWLYHFPIPPAMNEDSYHHIFLPTFGLGSVLHFGHFNRRHIQKEVATANVKEVTARVLHGFSRFQKSKFAGGNTEDSGNWIFSFKPLTCHSIRMK
ncbi:uncharacterized protein LOC144616179 isoform X2 [Panthera onca]